MTSFQIVALISPALIGFALLATAAFVRRQNKVPVTTALPEEEIGVLSDDIHRKLDLMTELVKSKAQARS